MKNEVQKRAEEVAAQSYPYSPGEYDNVAEGLPEGARARRDLELMRNTVNYFRSIYAAGYCHGATDMQSGKIA
jgi:hypothetical protein